MINHNELKVLLEKLMKRSVSENEIIVFSERLKKANIQSKASVEGLLLEHMQEFPSGIQKSINASDNTDRIADDLLKKMRGR